MAVDYGYGDGAPDAKYEERYDERCRRRPSALRATDACGGATATPQCALQDQSGDKFCALICSPDTLEWNLRAGDAQCGGAKASCKPIQGLGICTWDE